MSRFEPPDHAAEWLADETRTPRSGITARTPRPAREALYSFDLEAEGVPTSISAQLTYFDEVDDDGDTALARLMDGLLVKLSPRQREAVELVAVAGLTFGEAAKEMGVTKVTLYAHYRDAIRRLRELIAATPWAEAILGAWVVLDDGDLADDLAGDTVVALPKLSAADPDAA